MEVADKLMRMSPEIAVKKEEHVMEKKEVAEHEGGRIYSLARDVEKVKEVMSVNIQDVMERGEKLDGK